VRSVSAADPRTDRQYQRGATNVTKSAHLHGIWLSHTHTRARITWPLPTIVKTDIVERPGVRGGGGGRAAAVGSAAVRRWPWWLDERDSAMWSKAQTPLTLSDLLPCSFVENGGLQRLHAVLQAVGTTDPQETERKVYFKSTASYTQQEVHESLYQAYSYSSFLADCTLVTVKLLSWFSFVHLSVRLYRMHCG